MTLEGIVQTANPESKIISAYPPPSIPLVLMRGSKYGEDGASIDAALVAALPTQGYFEFVNKSSQFCALKLLKVGGDRLWEIARPSYTGEKRNKSCFPSELFLCCPFRVKFNAISTSFY